MKPMNMPEAVTRRRAEAFKRANGFYPENYSPADDSGRRLGRKARAKAALKFMGVALVALMLPAVAWAETKPAKPRTCAVFTEATLSDGSKVGVCAPTREGGKPAYLRTYQVVSVVNPSTGKAERLMVGFP